MVCIRAWYGMETEDNIVMYLIISRFSRMLSLCHLVANTLIADRNSMAFVCCTQKVPNRGAIQTPL